MPLLLTFDFPPERGGIQLYALRLAQGLQALGHATTVIAPRGPLRFVAAAVAFARHRFANADGQTIALSWRPALAAAIVPRRWRGTLTVFVHGTELDVRPGSVRDRAMRFVFARARHVIANSEFVARRVRALGLASAPVVVWPGVDARTIPRRPAAKPTVVFVGRLVARKGIDALIEALALLPRRDVVLRIIGDGPQRAALEALARERGVSERVTFSGSVDDETRDLALSEAWCFAMPSRAEGGDVEGFGIAYLEAAMAGLPAIGGAGSGADEAIAHGETGLLVDGRDASAVAAAIAALVDDRRGAEAMGAAGRRRALQNFAWNVNASAVARQLALAEAG